MTFLSQRRQITLRPREEFIVGRSDRMETQWPSKMACLRGSTVSPTQVASPRTARRLSWLTELAPCTCQLSSGWLGHRAAANYQPRVPFSSVDQNRIAQACLPIQVLAWRDRTTR